MELARLCGSCCGLLIFSAMILRGLLAGNAAEMILQRALIGLFGGLLLGTILGRVGLAVVSDNLPDTDGTAAAGTPAGDAAP